MVVRFDRNGLGYMLNPNTGELLIAENVEPAVNMDKSSQDYGRPKVAGSRA